MKPKPEIPKQLEPPSFSSDEEPPENPVTDES